MFIARKNFEKPPLKVTAVLSEFFSLPRLESASGKKFKVDLFTDGYIFSEQLPEDYIEKAKDILTLKNLTIKALSPVDIIITKAARLNARDEEDIKALVKLVEKEELIERFSQVVGTYAGNEKQYRYHLEVILRRFYTRHTFTPLAADAKNHQGR
ncbi:hypothetical protein HYU13_03220 [Candidatus Woesearchaeota archaeon]|nr:hypothetical protein [Candidatus Woesearchaeota archaeon]